MGWRKASVVVAACAVMAACGGAEQSELSDSEVLARCDSARVERAASVDPVFYEDPDFAYDLMQKPLTSVTQRTNFDTGVIEARGVTDGRAWFCLLDEATGDKWGWQD